MDAGIVRISGLGFAGPALYAFLLARYRIRDLVDLSKPWRLIFLLLAAVVCAGCGYRSVLILFGLTFCGLFFFEGLHRTRLLAVFCSVALIGSAIVLPNIQKMPLPVQRTISFLPVKVNPLAEESANSSTDWRLNVWKSALPEVPKYFFKGKGYMIDPAALFLTEMSTRHKIVDPYEIQLLTGDYHSGPLSVIIPFGIFGVIAFAWFLGASIRYLHYNYRFADERLKTVNTFLLAFFSMKIVFFIVVFGSLFSDLASFVGLLGLSVSLNGPPSKILSETETAQAEGSPLEAFS